MSEVKNKYSHLNRRSVPAITTEIIDTKIANVLETINKYPDLTAEQLEFIQDIIKKLIQEKEDRYLVPSTVQVNTTRRVNFAPGTKTAGKGKRSKKNKKTKRRR